ncbi:MAG: cell division protein FtsA [Candidatus Omnitrophica bacterium]|nr:cell division protein FtsA [Candidatus Omnitrophota bacterium]MBU4477996.1 cell division protein FtsA [Candidatus Omnitrophota bacterium]MCG2703929.1 cell division protein FtsA [Candidatus Omnitrophota bacterium]
MIKNNSLVTGLDIGSAKTAICAGGLDPEGRVEIYAAVMVKTRGIERGVISDPGEAAGCVEEALKKLEHKLSGTTRCRSLYGRKKAKINSVFLAIGGDHILGNNTKGVYTLSHRATQISRRDRHLAIESAKSLTTAIDREILHAIAQEFVVDGYKKIKDPLGVYGTRLGVRMHIVTAGLPFVTNMINSVNRAGLDVDGVVYSGFAGSMVMLTEHERHSGVIFLECGAGTINILFFNEGALQYTNVIPVGGDDITMRVAERFGVDFAQAEELKMQYKSLSSYLSVKSDWGEDKIIIKKDSARYESITRSELTSVIDEKLKDILSLIKKELELSGLISRANSGIIMSGGMAFMDGIIEKTEEMLGRSVTLGIMRGFISSMEGVGNAFYAGGIGVIMHALKEQKEAVLNIYPQQGILGRLATKVKNVYYEYF